MHFQNLEKNLLKMNQMKLWRNMTRQKKAKFPEKTFKEC